MNRFIAATAVPAFAAAGFAGAARAHEAHVQLGVLTCEVDSGFGMVVVSDKTLTCTFKPSKGKSETYTGSIKKLGIDIGYTATTRIAWVVVAATKGAYKPGALAGTYVGGSTEATMVLDGALLSDNATSWRMLAPCSISAFIIIRCR